MPKRALQKVSSQEVSSELPPDALSCCPLLLERGSDTLPLVGVDSAAKVGPAATSPSRLQPAESEVGNRSPREKSSNAPSTEARGALW